MRIWKKKGLDQFDKLKSIAKGREDSVTEEVVASNVYKMFVANGVSKSIAAQYLAQRLHTKYENGELSPEEFRKQLPKYLVAAIDYVTGVTNT